MRFNVDYKYKNRIEEISQKYKKFAPLFGVNTAVEIGFEIGNKEVLVSCNTGINEERAVYRFRQIKKVVSFTDGLLVVFKEKKFVFLPVTDNETNDEDLLFIAHDFYDKFRAKYQVNERLYTINYDSSKQKRKRLNLTFADSPIVFIVLAVIAIFMGIFMVNEPNNYLPVARDKCIVVSGEYDSFEKDEDDVIILYLKDNDEGQWIDYSCYSSELYSKIATLKKGDKLVILLHPNNDYVVELMHGNEELLNFDFAQKAMYEDIQGIEWVGYVIIAMGIFSLIVSIYRFKCERDGRLRLEEAA